MSAPAARIDRRALRRNEPGALATILVGQLMAYRCSTVYAPTTTRLDAFVHAEVLPRLREQLDVRTVIVDRWEKKTGPTVAQLAQQLHRQLEIEDGPPDMKPLAALEAVLQRAERRSDRPILVVLYRLEELLDDKRDAGEVGRFVEALTRMASMPHNGLHLVLGVKEEDLGAFRDLLRGRWRLLANDIRIRPGGKKWLLSIPLAVVAFVSTKTAEVAVIATACVGTGAVAGTAACVQICDESEAMDACKQENGRLRRAAATPPSPPPLPPPPAPVVLEPPLDDSSSTGAGTDSGSGSTGGTDTGDATGDATTTSSEPPPLSTPPTKRDMCSPRPKDSDCGACVRAQCCTDLQACKQPAWRKCVLTGRIGEPDCTPEAVEKECRGLALCALEYKCRPDCFNN